MIGLVAALVGGIIAGVKTPFVAPAIYLLSRYRKNPFLISFGVYCISLSYEFRVTNVFDLDPITVLSVLLPTILLLEDGLNEDRSGSFPEYLLAAFMLSGLIFREIFVFSTLLALMNMVAEDRAKRGAAILAAGALILAAGLFVIRSFLDVPGGASTQAAVVTSITAFAVLLFWRRADFEKI
ncbi:hypothetical protein [Geoglobus acetivorans]|uniref:Integral membrane protein n=1 Tax=Geoglobus acetivorans TaxID=565033 RepID=A0ABZ3H499_GEOAI|nr:hypothetical protein [Geoglobus acetivorans]